MTQTTRISTTTVSWRDRAGFWIGIGINPAILTVGGGLASRTSLAALAILIPIGALVLTTLAVIQGLISRRQRAPLAQRAADTFGTGIGANILNLLMAFGMTGWIGFYIGVSGFSLANLLQIPGWAGATIVATSIWVLSNLGLNRWNAMVWVTTLSAMGVAIVALIAVGLPETWQTSATPIQITDASWVVGSIVAYGILFTLRNGDFTWDLHSDIDVIKDGVALIIPLTLSLIIGALLFAQTGDWNIPDILARTDLAILGQLFLLISVIGPAMGSLHSGTLAISTIAGLSKRQSTALICAVSLFLGATRFDYQLLPMLDFLGAILPPALVVTLATVAIKPKPSTRVALLAWFLGAAIALIFKFQGSLMHIVVGALVSLAILVAMRSKQTNNYRNYSP